MLYQVNKALAPAGLAAKHGAARWSRTAIALQIVTNWLVMRPAARHFAGSQKESAVPVE